MYKCTLSVMLYFQMYKCREEKGDIVARAYAPERVAGDRSEFDPRPIQHWLSCRIQAKSKCTTLHKTTPSEST